METMSFKEWVGEHKKEIIIGSVITVGLVTLTCLGVKNKDSILDFADNISSLKKTGDDAIGGCVENKQSDFATDVINKVEQKLTRCPHPVNEHIRNLKEGCHASAEKILEAAEKGIVLEENQTIIDSYVTGQKVA